MYVILNDPFRIYFIIIIQFHFHVFTFASNI